MTIGELKNQGVKFTSGTSSTLKITLHRGKKNWAIAARQKMEDGKIKTGCRAWFDLGGEEGKAQAEFDRLVAEAKAAGWIMGETESKANGGFTKIPPAPMKKPQLATPAVSNKRT